MGYKESFSMTDHHIHIGQFNEIYYDAHEVFEIIEKVGAEFGIHEVNYSSTSSCRKDVELPKIEEELAYAQTFSSEKLKVKPYLWFTTNYSELGISVKSAMENFDYCGIKIHPIAHKWDFSNSKHKKSFEQIFEYSSEKKLPILIHCGISKKDHATRFEEFIKSFPDSTVILAHSNPLDITVEMLKKYPNVKSDIACVPEKNVKKLVQIIGVNSCEFSSSDGKKEISDLKVLFGTDFPVTNYFSKIVFNERKSLEEQYRKDCEIICFYA